MMLEEVIRGHDGWLTCDLDLSHCSCAPAPVFGIYVLHTVPIVGAIVKDSVLRERCVVETVWMVYLTEPG